LALVITEKSTVACTHQGSVKLSSKQSKLKVSGANVLVVGDLPSSQISGCVDLTNTTTGIVQCQLVLTQTAGVATKLKVSGKGVLLESAQGQTNGINGGPQTWSVKAAGQSKLKAS
jgi:hypothetical protein